MGFGEISEDPGAHFFGFSGQAGARGEGGEVDVDFEDGKGVVCDVGEGWCGGWGSEGGDGFEEEDADGEEGGGGDGKGGFFLEGGQLVWGQEEMAKEIQIPLAHGQHPRQWFPLARLSHRTH